MQLQPSELPRNKQWFDSIRQQFWYSLSAGIIQKNASLNLPKVRSSMGL